MDRVRTTIVLLMLMAVGLAGCAGDEAAITDSAVTVDKETFQLAAGKGAIAGLLVDDRFRPIDLEDTAETEFQSEGFVLLQEIGEQAQTNENGEFTFVDLEPGTYTVRITASGHEAIPQRIQVQEGLFNEVSVVARRVLSEGGSTVTEEYAAFASCLPNAIALSFRPDCSGDLSGDSDRSGFKLNYTALPGVTWVVAEALFNQDPQNGASFDVTMRNSDLDEYSAAVLWEGRHAAMHLQNGALTPDEAPPGDVLIPWNNTGTFTIEMFGRGYFAEEIRTAYEPLYETYPQDPCIPTGLGYCLQEIPMRRGVGGMLGVQAEFLITVFLGEPEVDPLAYCVLC